MNEKKQKEQRLSVIGETVYVSKTGRKQPGYICLCSCGNKKIVSKASFNSGCTRSCGCLIKEFNAERRFHNGNRGEIYQDPRFDGVDHHVIDKIINSYKAMISRCTKKDHVSYMNYGGRGITVCEEWMSDKKEFIAWSLSNGYELGKSIDRIDVDGNYSPENCRWSTTREQARNTRRNVVIVFNGERKVITDVSEQEKIDFKILSYLAKRGYELKKNDTV